MHAILLQNPVLVEKLTAVLGRFDELQAILVSTAEGVPLLKVAHDEQQAATFEYAETVLPTVFAGAAEQIGKLKFGVVQSITSFFGSLVLVHINHLPLVITLISSNSASVGALQTVGLQLRDALAPLKKCVDSADVH
ncbi:TPA: hypothetical protein N0F65_009297 [Lagenidium giganteum]|uniref:Ragulator complex protein LAMTOR3 n=1 Tax=Lagenidium giganteum TaxID=4803 RepID=A0AAV2YQF3_9STRA|nr:TPA: hypothetical protein N0F65_009297 [Lagenidium giganteum]